MTRRAASPLRGPRAPHRPGARSIWLATLLGIALVAGCGGRPFLGPGLTGTCDGACAHYVQCKPGHAEVDRHRCLAECPEVFSDHDSLMAYESLACQDAVEYVDGSVAQTASHR